MATFKTPLPRLLAQTLDHALNEMIRLDTGHQIERQLSMLTGRRISLRLQGTGIDLYFSGNPHGLSVEAKPPSLFDRAYVDTAISGSPQALLAMAVPNWITATDSVTIDGDAQAAQALEQLLRRLNPDWESLFVERFGTVIGHQLYQLWVQALSTGQMLTEVGIDQASHYMREESELVVDRTQFSTFTQRIDELTEAIDRFEANASRKGLL